MDNAHKTAPEGLATIDRPEPSENLQAFLGFIEKFLDGDVADAVGFLHPGVVADEPESLPFGGEYRATFTSHTSGASFITSIAEECTFRDGLIAGADISPRTRRGLSKTLGFSEASAPGAG